MRSCLLLCVLAAGCAAQNVSVTPVPPDPLELATGAIDNVTTPQQRSTSVIALLDRATTNYTMHARVSSPHVLEIAVPRHQLPPACFPPQPGALREALDLRTVLALGRNSRHLRAHSHQFQRHPVRPADSSSHSTSSEDGRPGGLQSHAGFGAATGRDPNVHRELERSKRHLHALYRCAAAAAIVFRPRLERERILYRSFHRSPADRLEAPGIYAAYDYANALHFHGQTLPSGIVVTEAGKTVIQAQASRALPTPILPIRRLSPRRHR